MPSAAFGRFPLAYRLTNDQRFLDAAVNEMLTASKFKGLESASLPRHGRNDRRVCHWLRLALRRDGIPRIAKPSAMRWSSSGWIPESKSSSEVAGGPAPITTGTKSATADSILGALAIADEKPELADQMIGLCLKSLPNGLKAYRPAGAYPEGPGYWVYGTTFTVLTILGLDSALGHDFDIHKSKALEPTVEYRLHMEGPSHLFFNYADSGLGASPDLRDAWALPTSTKNRVSPQLQIKSMIDYFKLDTPKVQRPNERFAALNVIYYPECKKMVANESFQTLPPRLVFRRSPRHRDHA